MFWGYYALAPSLENQSQKNLSQLIAPFTINFWIQSLSNSPDKRRSDTHETIIRTILTHTQQFGLTHTSMKKLQLHCSTSL